VSDSVKQRYILPYGEATRIYNRTEGETCVRPILSKQIQFENDAKKKKGIGREM
jgi:hypothetical protein